MTDPQNQNDYSTDQQVPIFNSLWAAFRIARGDFSAYAALPVSISGFWQSFWAAPIVLPMRMVLLWLSYTTLLEQGLTPSAIVGFEAFGFLIDWAAFPLVMIPAARMMKVTHRYVPYIIAYNWTKVPTYLALSAVIALFMATSDGETMNPLAGMLLLIVTAWSFWLRWRVARDVLEVTSFQAVAFVLLDTAVALFVSGMLNAIIGDGAAPVQGL